MDIPEAKAFLDSIVLNPNSATDAGKINAALDAFVAGDQVPTRKQLDAASDVLSRLLFPGGGIDIVLTSRGIRFVIPKQRH